MSCDYASNNKSGKINKSAPFYTHKISPVSPRISKHYDQSKIEKFWPFLNMVASELEEESILNTYAPLFEKYGAEGNGYSWAALLKVILKKEKPDLLKHLDFDPEAGGFYLFADSENSQRQFVTFAQKAFKDKNKLIKYLTGPDKEQALKYTPN